MVANQAVVGRAVSIALPDGRQTTGKVLSVGTPTQDGDQGTVIIPVVRLSSHVASSNPCCIIMLWMPLSVMKRLATVMKIV